MNRNIGKTRNLANLMLCPNWALSHTNQYQKIPIGTSISKEKKRTVTTSKTGNYSSLAKSGRADLNRLPHDPPSDYPLNLIPGKSSDFFLKSAYVLIISI
jgi:hypothetical protein